MTQVATIGELYDLVECPQCEDYYIPGEPEAMSMETARLRLWSLCMDAGWTEAKATRYLNRVAPLSDQRVST